MCLGKCCSIVVVNNSIVLVNNSIVLDIPCAWASMVSLPNPDTHTHTPTHTHTHILA